MGEGEGSYMYMYNYEYMYIVVYCKYMYVVHDIHSDFLVILVIIVFGTTSPKPPFIIMNVLWKKCFNVWMNKSLKEIKIHCVNLKLD